MSNEVEFSITIHGKAELSTPTKLSHEDLKEIIFTTIETECRPRSVLERNVDVDFDEDKEAGLPHVEGTVKFFINAVRYDIEVKWVYKKD